MCALSKIENLNCFFLYYLFRLFLRRILFVVALTTAKLSNDERIDIFVDFPSAQCQPSSCVCHEDGSFTWIADRSEWDQADAILTGHACVLKSLPFHFTFLSLSHPLCTPHTRRASLTHHAGKHDHRAVSFFSCVLPPISSTVCDGLRQRKILFLLSLALSALSLTCG